VLDPPIDSLAGAQETARGALGEVGGLLNEMMRRLLYLPEQASTIAFDVDRVHYLEIIIMTGIALVTASAGFYFLCRYRRRPGDGRTPRVEAPFIIEVAAAGGLLALFTFFWAISFRQYAHQARPPTDAMEVYVTSKQWMWKFSYPGGQRSAGVLYVPAGRPVKLLITSRDVIHSFYVPAFRIKKDAVPGQYTSIWFQALGPGRWPIRCAELCGVGHSNMLAEVVALSPEQYTQWLRGTWPTVPQADVGLPEAVTPVTLVEQGREAAAVYGCLKCHSIDGSPHIGPTWLGLYGMWQPLGGGGGVRVDEAFITSKMMDPTATVVPGYPQVMPSFQGLIRPAEVAAIIEYIKSLREPAVPENAAQLPPPPTGPRP
jgi:cytochrome c oxidase subunit 2